MSEKRLKHRQRVMDYINTFGSITSMEAYRDLGIVKLSNVISDMVKDDEPIVKTWETSFNRWGDPVRYKRYSLQKVD